MLNNDPNTYLFIISIQNKSIETICEYKHGLIHNYNRLFVMEKTNEIKYRANFYYVLSIDKKTFTLKKYIPLLLRPIPLKYYPLNIIRIIIIISYY